ncbi:amino acid starvation-responsive transcription factor GCN4 [Aspergillus melleus]|uniref:amino acid starvation-responsive transcription factor GCN4 n=1 Tax=Aspergillus melleus TaxID=138277 RepID=UPI001E8CB450|nr:General control protein [Aspergillus melleus]KAH8422639.1 General control protein [Aspergillus melleus]
MASNTPAPTAFGSVIEFQRQQQQQLPAGGLRSISPLSSASTQGLLCSSTLDLQQPQQQHQPQQPRQLASSPVQVPRVARLASQSTGFPQSLSHRSSPSSRKHLLRVHAASVASNSAPNSASLNRPPVPLFHSPTHLSYYQNQQLHPTHHHRMMSTPNMAHDLPDLFDFSTDQFGADFDLSMLSPQQIPTGIMAPKEAMADAPPGTISPKDLLMDASAPPSTSFTDLSTPSFDSPGYFSQDTSPMFATDMELAPGHEEWDSLFPTQDAFPALPLDSTTLDVAPAAAPKPQETEEVPMPSPKARSPSSAPSPSSRQATKPSTVAGVNARQRKPLPPIKFDSCDPVAMKRARNTEAARKSRARKLERQDVMERRIAELEKSLEEAEQREQYWKAMAQAQTQV